MVLPRRRMNSRGCHCAPLSSPFFERPIPSKIKQASNDYYFEQQSHTKGEIRKRPRAKAILILREGSWPGRDHSFVYGYSKGFRERVASQTVHYSACVHARLTRVPQNRSRCSHSPVGCLPSVKANAGVNRPQAGGYSTCETCYSEGMVRPSSKIMFVFAVRCRILRGSRYSSQLSHSLARCTLIRIRAPRCASVSSRLRVLPFRRRGRCICRRTCPRSLWLAFCILRTQQDRRCRFQR